MLAMTLRSVIFMAILAIVNAMPADFVYRSTPIKPSTDNFYALPDGLDRVSPGTILRHRSPPAPIAAFGLAPVNLAATHQILYRTTDSLGNATATVLTILIPHNADKSKVLSYQVAEDAASIDCAPSYAFQLGSATGPLLGTIITQAELFLIEAALEQGWVVIVPDFEGPKGAYLANALAGHAVLDGIRAAFNSVSFTGIHTGTVTMWGYSGGSLATNWAAELQPTYAPELNIAGAAVGGTIPNITNVAMKINKSIFAGIIPTGMLGLAAQYPDIGDVIDQHLQPEYVEKFHRPLKQCFLADAADFLLNDVLGMFDDRQLIYTNPTAIKILDANALGSATPRIPFFWYKSVGDEVSSVKDTDALVSKYCDAGVGVEYVRDLASAHGPYAVIGAPKALSWLKRVMDGHVPTSGCSTETTISSLIDPATFEIIPKFILDALLDLLYKPVGPVMFG